MEDPNTLTNNDTEVTCKYCEKEFKTELDCLRHTEKCLTKHNDSMSNNLKNVILQLANEYDVNRKLDKKFDKLNMDYKELLEKLKKRKLI